MTETDWSAIVALVYPRLMWLSILTLMDVLFGVAVALKEHKFSLEKLGSFVYTDVVPVLIWVAVAVLSSMPTEFVPGGINLSLDYVVYAGVFIKIIASLLESFAAFGVLVKPLGKLGVRAE